MNWLRSIPSACDMSRIYKLITYVPEADLETLKQGLFAAGAGRQGNYDMCSWQCLGTGQFRPLEGSDPCLGSQNKVEKVQEWRLETLVDKAVLSAVLEALLKIHPYEEPAYDLVLLSNSKDLIPN